MPGLTHESPEFLVVSLSLRAEVVNLFSPLTLRVVEGPTIQLIHRYVPSCPVYLVLVCLVVLQLVPQHVPPCPVYLVLVLY